MDHPTLPRITDDESFPFTGELDLDFSFEMLGHRVERSLRITYFLRPQWRHFDPELGRLVPEGGEPDRLPSYLYYAGILTAPEEFSDLLLSTHPVTPEWAEANVLSYPPVLGPTVTEAVWHRIEGACAEQDRARREAHGALLCDRDYENITAGPHAPQAVAR